MTQDEIIELARQAGFDVKEWGDETLIRTVHSKGYFVVINQKLETFAKLVAEHEREACAKVCEEERINAVHYSAPTQSNWLAKKIRAR